MCRTSRALAACWTLMLLSAFLCEPVLSKGGRGGARGAARGSARGTGRARVKSMRYGSSPMRVAGAAAAGAAVGLAAGGWYASSQTRSDQTQERYDDRAVQYSNGTDGDFYSAMTSHCTKCSATRHRLLLSVCVCVLCQRTLLY